MQERARGRKVAASFQSCRYNTVRARTNTRHRAAAAEVARRTVAGAAMTQVDPSPSPAFKVNSNNNVDTRR
jgi:hypothetical protein